MSKANHLSRLKITTRYKAIWIKVVRTKQKASSGTSFFTKKNNITLAMLECTFSFLVVSATHNRICVEEKKFIESALLP